MQQISSGIPNELIPGNGAQTVSSTSQGQAPQADAPSEFWEYMGNEMTGRNYLVAFGGELPSNRK